MLLFRHPIPEHWLRKVLGALPEVLLDHAHLERRAATTALTLVRYTVLRDRVRDLNAIAIEELQHFDLVLDLLGKRGIPFGPSRPSPWISGLMRDIRQGTPGQVIDHLVCCALIEGRSCEKFQVLARTLEASEPALAAFYAGLVESEGNHYATYLLMARAIDEAETRRRLDHFLDVEARLIADPHPHPILH